MVKRRIISEEEKIRRIKSWASSVGLNGQAIADQMVAKYGVDQAYKLASGAMTRPADLAKQQGLKFSNSKNLLTDLAKDAPETPQTREATPQQQAQVSQQQAQALEVSKTSQTLKQMAQPKGQSVLTGFDINSKSGYLPSEVAPIILNRDVAKNRQLRQEYINTQFPTLEEKDFKSHDEYVAALRKQYQEMRQYEYGLVCQQEALDMFNISMRKDVNPNKEIWTGFKPDKCESDSTYQDKGALAKCEWMGNEVKRRNAQYASCAGTATRVNNAISERMGYAGKDQFYQPYGYCTSAAGIHNNPATKAYKHSNTSLKKMIEEGHVGPGTILSVPSNKAQSGYHALTVAEVIKDKNGKITDVVLQANNGTSLRTYSVNTIDKSLRDAYFPGSTKSPFLITSTHEWMDQKIQQEAANIPEAELVACIKKEREGIGTAVNRLARIEDVSYGLEDGNKKAVNYKGAVKKQTAEIQHGIAMAQNDIALVQAIPDELMGKAAPGKSYTAEERESVRKALLDMDTTSFEHMKSVDIAPDLKADRAAAEAQFEKAMAGYFASNGKGDDKKSMKLASDLLVSYLLSDDPDKSLDNFHKYVEQATQSNANLNMVLMKNAREGR